MKELYFEAEMERVRFDEVDIIATSSNMGEEMRPSLDEDELIPVPVP